MPRILITGADSFVGTNYRKFSVFKDIEEISLLTSRTEEIDFAQYNIVLHLAAIVHSSTRISEEKYIKVNRDLCLEVAENAKGSGVNHFIFMSTVKVYGESEKNEIRNEDSLCNPDDLYGRSKLDAELGLRKLEDENFRVAIIRAPLIYGEGVKANMLRIIKLVNKFPVLPFGKLENRRNYTCVENLVGYIDRIIKIHASGTFLALDDNPISTTKLVKYIADSLDKKVYLFKLPEILKAAGASLWPGIFLRLYGSDEFENKKTLLVLNYYPFYSTEEGIRKMVKSYLELKSSVK